MTKQSWRNDLNPVAVLGYFMGAVSLLNLLSDVLQVRSDILLWVNSYRRLVERIGEFLFGWIDFDILGLSLEVSSLEVHTLVILGLVMRGRDTSVLTIPPHRSRDSVIKSEAVLFSVLGLLLYYVLVVAQMAVLPSFASITVAGLGVVFLATLGHAPVDRSRPEAGAMFSIYDVDSCSAWLFVALTLPLLSAVLIIIWLVRPVRQHDVVAHSTSASRGFIMMRTLSAGVAGIFLQTPHRFRRNIVYSTVVLVATVITDQLWFQLVQS